MAKRITELCENVGIDVSDLVHLVDVSETSCSGSGLSTKTTIGDLADFINDLAPETLTSISINANMLEYVDEDGNTTSLDLSLYLDDSNLARIVSGTLDAGTGIATFTRDDSTTFTIDLSSLIDVKSTMTASNTGHVIGTHDDGNGATVDIEETITTITDNGDGTYVYTNENGVTTTIGTKHVCETFNPTTEGIAEGFSTGSHWYNTTEDVLYTFMCGQWIGLEPEPEYVDESGNNILAENGDTLDTEQDNL